ncbi:hypothetical protein [Silvibacterium sp.]|uniref:hypothetical protein n=1 Tax=Silvibacterium sp. TaxID=1964179 RepID=UPI0039E474D3
MKRKSLVWVAAGLSIVCSAAAAMAQDLGYWRASSKTAHDITGDIGIGENNLLINFLSYNIARAKQLTPPEVSTVFDTDSAGTKRANLYGLTIPGTKKFLHKNTLCGSDDVKWMVTYVDGNTLQLALFSGETAPTFTPDAMANATNLCGTFTYTR